MMAEKPEHEPRSDELHSVVVPIFNETAVIDRFRARITAALAGLPEYEIIAVDDGSGDGSWDLLQAVAAADPRWRCIRLARNFGQQAALTAGIDAARGDTVTVIDVDLQDPPELICDMVDCWRDGADVVYAVRSARHGESWFKKASATLFYRALRALTAVDIPADHSEFRLVSRRAAAGLRSMREHNRYTRGLASWVGLNRAYVYYERDSRAAGETKYSVVSLVRVAADSVVSFSARPLQIASALGFAASFVSLGYGLWNIAYWAITHRPVEGWTSLMTVLLFFSGVQLVTVGIIGEYIGRMYDEARGRPLYTVADVVGFGARCSEWYQRVSCVPPRAGFFPDDAES